MKACTRCKENKKAEEFFKDNRAKDGRYSACKNCLGSKILSLEVKRNPTLRNVTDYYFYMLSSRVKRGKGYEHVKCLVSRDDMYGFFQKNWSSYMTLHAEWSRSNFAHKLAPTIDRLDPKGHYELNNMQIISCRDNMSRATKGVSKTLKHRQKLAEVARRREAIKRKAPLPTNLST